MRSSILFLVAVLAAFGCSTYERQDECEPEVCDGLDNDCDGFVDETRHECPDGSMVDWCRCDADQNFDCLEDPGQQCRDTRCDDGTDPLCEMEPPECAEGEILAWQNYCYACVDPETCQPPGCQPEEEQTYTCPDGQEVLWCVCGDDRAWACIDSPESQCRDTRCDDGSEPLCDMIPPVCQDWEILAWQNNCYRCVNPQTCRPWGEPDCESDRDCPAEDTCDFCATSSCPMCADCVAACRPHGCETEPEPLCNLVRPDCGFDATAVVRDGCWVCVSLDTCQPEICQPGEELPYICPDGQEVFWCVCGEDADWECITSPESQCRDTHCDDGTEILCDMIPPVCQDWEILAYQDHCYACVNPVSCRPWGQPGCQDHQDCPPDEYCDSCATSSCPDCDDCLSACLPHGCPTEMELTCYCARPECTQGGVSVIQDGCWICVTWDACVPTGEGC